MGINLYHVNWLHAFFVDESMLSNIKEESELNQSYPFCSSNTEVLLHYRHISPLTDAVSPKVFEWYVSISSAQDIEVLTMQYRRMFTS